MGINIIIPAIIILLIIVWLIYYFLFAKKNEEDSKSLYTRGLNHMISGNYQEAIKCFKKYVFKDTENTQNIDVYIKLGMLFRKVDKPEKALKVHKSLLYRQHISKSQKVSILTQIGEDYKALGDKEKAIKTTQDILAIDKQNEWALKTAWKLYRDLDKWQEAFEHLKNYDKHNKSNKRLLAIYKTRVGLQKYKDNDYHDARLIFRKARKYDRNCEAPYFYMADSYIKDNRPDDAFEWWKKFIEIAPQRAHFIYPQLKKVLFQQNNFDEIYDFYKKVLKKVPNHLETTIELAEYKDRKGKTDEAISLIENIIDEHPDSIKAKISLARILVEDNNHQTKDLLLEIINQIEQEDKHVCSNCGYKIDEISWICPQCGRIDTFFVD
ncbi:MAG: tetratricopeptide repeat protein [Candidatus Marinimicrobia bacterium]|nr:tetratricopeptide repeat protein [Candidatus Neomarinimicrobiota bacterium]